MVVLEDRLLVRHEPFAGELLAQSFAESGISVRLGRSTTRVVRPSIGGRAQVYLDDGSHLEADEILVAAGRRANVNDLGLETVGVDARGPLEVDATTRVKAAPRRVTIRRGGVNSADRRDRHSDVIGPFPTTCEIWLQLLEAYGL